MYRGRKGQREAKGGLRYKVKGNEVNEKEVTTLSFVWRVIRREGSRGLKMNQAKCGNGRVVQTQRRMIGEEKMQQMEEVQEKGPR